MDDLTTRVAKQISFHGRNIHDVSKDAEEFWENTGTDARDIALIQARAVVALVLGDFEWRDIDDPPHEPMAVLFYFGNAKWRTTDGSLATELPEYRQERVSVGFFDGQDWCENGTGHDVFEDWRLPDYTPTQWKPLGNTPSHAAIRALGVQS